jgi:trans-2,3-dihydro-3-hydroxyanthranilate isomerase
MPDAVSLPFYWVDAFTAQALGGNPCAVVLDADALDDARMLALAREMNLSETAFVMRSSRADFRARYFTPEREIPLAGHPTLAVTRALLDAGRLPHGGAGEPHAFRLELTAGVVEVAIQGPLLTMTQLKPSFLREYDAREVLPAFGLEAADLLPGARIQTVSTGTPSLQIPLRDLDTLRRASMGVKAYRTLRDTGDFFSPHLFCLQGATPAGRTFARHLGVPPDTAEDPFTGSATGALGAYLWRHGLIDSPRFVAEQGHWLGRPGSAQVEVVGPREDIAAVRVGGEAVVIVRGMIDL